mgnify:CR=1 FL=1
MVCREERPEHDVEAGRGACARGWDRSPENVRRSTIRIIFAAACGGRRAGMSWRGERSESLGRQTATKEHPQADARPEAGLRMT